MPHPTEAQAIAGNYRMGTVRLFDLPAIRIENVRGSYREGTAPDGTQWRNRLAAHYGYFAGTRGADGDAIDVFVGPFPESESAWVINQRHVGGKSGFDEHKCMVGFHTEAQARDAYMHSFDRGWTGLASIVPVSINQLKWWLKFGNHKLPITAETLPFDGEKTMLDKVLWDSNAQPVTSPLHRVMYDLRVNDADAGLLLDACTMADYMADPDIEAVPVYDALVVEVASMTRKMALLQKTMETAGVTVKPTEMTIADPVKSRGVLQVMVLFTMSDGQTVSIWFHNPDTTPAKLTPMDELISWKWLINKKDVTIVVAPERGAELNVREVSRRVMRLVEKNSEAFQKANAKAGERAAITEALKTEIGALEGELAGLQRQIEVAKVSKDDSTAATQAKLRGLLQDLSKLTEMIDKEKAFGAGADTALLETLFNNHDDLADQIRALRGEDATGRTSWATWQALRAAEEARNAPEIDPLTPEGYAKVMADEALQLSWQDKLDSFFGERIVDVRNALRELDWFGEGQSLSKGYFRFSYDVAGVGAGNNVVGVKYEVYDAKNIAVFTLQDDLTKTPEQLAAEIDATIPTSLTAKQVEQSVAMEEHAEKATRELGGTMSAWEQSGAAEWKYANATFGEKTLRVGASTGGVVSINGHPFDPSNELILSLKQTIAAMQAALDKIPGGDKSIQREMDDELTYARQGTYSPSYLAENRSGALVDYFGKNQTVSVAHKAALADAWESRTQTEGNTPIATVDAAYKFDNATDAFKEWVADSVQDVDYSPFTSAMLMDKKAKELGASVAWDVSFATLDSAKEEGEGEDFDPQAEFDAAPELDDDDKEVEAAMDGDFRGHPFRGNQHKKAGRASGAAVNSSIRAKSTERRGDAKSAAKAHETAHHAHKAAGVEATGKAKKYHKVMAAFHATKSGAKLDSVQDDTPFPWMLDDAEGYSTVIGVITKDGVTAGRAHIGGDGKAMVFTGAEGTTRVQYKDSEDGGMRNAMWSDDDAGEMVGWLLTPKATENTGNGSPAISGETDASRLNAADAMVPKDAIMSDDPKAIEKLDLKLTALRLRQEFMKKANKFFKKGDDAGLLAMGLTQGQINKMKAGDFAGRIGFADYMLTNNNGVMAATRKRMDALIAAKQKEAAVPEVTELPALNDPVEVPAAIDPGETVDPIKAVDTAYLETFTNGTADMFAADILERLEPMFTKYENDAPMTDLLNRAAQAYSDAAVKAAQAALAG